MLRILYLHVLLGAGLQCWCIGGPSWAYFLRSTSAAIFPKSIKRPLVKIPPAVATELQLLATLAPLMVCDLAARMSQTIFATDASEYGGAIVSSEVKETYARALWRNGRKKGGYSRLLSREEALVKKLDPEVFEKVEQDAPSRPGRPLALRYHFIEICGGAGKIAKELGARGWKVGPVIDLDRSSAYNLCFLEVIRWLFYLIENDLLDSFILEPPCTTFSPAAHPCLRSYVQPRGFKPKETRTHLGTTLALRSLAMMYLASISEVCGMLETPLRSKMAWLEEWKRLLELGLCHERKLASCMYGSPHKKEFRFLVANMASEKLERRCDGSHEHIPIQGKYTKPSATYTDELAYEIANVFEEAILFKTRKFANFDVETKGLESPLGNDILISSDWKVDSSWKWKGSSHINIYEAATFSRLLKRLARTAPSTRFSAFLDSNVTISAVCKGRTPSFGLRPTLRRIGAITIVGALYPSLHFSPTRMWR